MRTNSSRFSDRFGKKRWLYPLLALASFLDPRPASAQTERRAPSRWEQTPPAAEPEQPTRSYGWQTALVDGAAVGFMAGALATYRPCWLSPCNNSTSGMFFAASLATYAVGGPIVHGGHGRWGTAAASFGLRAAPIVLGGALVAGDQEVGAPILLGGAIAAMIVDATVLAREAVPPASARFQLTPVVDPRRRAGFVLVTRDF